MSHEIETIIMNIIVDSGSCRSYAMEAINYAKEGDFKAAEDALANAEAEILKAHKLQTTLLQKEAGGEKTEISLIIIHSQDHLMTAMLAKDMAREFIELYKKLENK